MRNYGPFDKPYGAATWSGIKERLKAFVVLLYSIAVMMIDIPLSIAAESTSIAFFQFLFFTAIVITIPIILSLMFLGIVWAYFPEFKPHWRKWLT